MDIAPKLDIRQKQSLTLTPFLQQAIRILQMNQQELLTTVQEQLLENPLLESEAQTDDPPAPGDTEPKAARNSTSDESDGTTDSLSAASQDGVNDQALDVNYDNVYDGDLIWQQRGNRRNDFSESTSSFEDNVSATPSLHTELARQISWLFRTPKDRTIAHALIEHLDENGWLEATFIQVAEKLNCHQDDVERVIRILHKVEPSGLFARNLKECLTIQLKEREPWSDSLKKMLDRLDWVGQGRWDDLQDVCGCNAQTLDRHLGAIRRCNPRPADSFDTSFVQIIRPDVELRRTVKGEWQIELVYGSLPPLILNQEYYHNLQSTAQQRPEKRYIYQKWQEANWLVKAIDQRNSTLIKVSVAIVKRQEGFFNQGIMALRPMVLRDIAEDVEMHESTISRITTGKYLASPRGTFELKFFFTATLSGTSGGDLSAESVRHMVKLIIEQEDPKAVLSDNTIAKALRDEGVQVARRTIAKYRETLGIPGSSVRRRSISHRPEVPSSEIQAKA